MTREEIIQGLRDIDTCQIWESEVLDEAIKALEREPTTKNNLGVDLVSRAEVLKLMQDNWHTHNGDWAMQESMDDIRALPPVTPQEPMVIPIAEVKFDEDKLKELVNRAVLTVTPQESCDYKVLYENYLKKSSIVIEQLRVDRDRLLEDIDKIRAEIDNALSDGMIHKKTVLGIIDKYKAESEEPGNDREPTKQT